MGFKGWRETGWTRCTLYLVIHPLAITSLKNQQEVESIIPIFDIFRRCSAYKQLTFYFEINIFLLFFRPSVPSVIPLASSLISHHLNLELSTPRTVS